MFIVQSVYAVCARLRTAKATFSDSRDSDLPSRLVDASGLVEQATVGAGEGKRLVGIELAALRHGVVACPATDIVATVIVYRHRSIMPYDLVDAVAW